MLKHKELLQRHKAHMAECSLGMFNAPTLKPASHLQTNSNFIKFQSITCFLCKRRTNAVRLVTIDQVVLFGTAPFIGDLASQQPCRFKRPSKRKFETGRTYFCSHKTMCLFHGSLFDRNPPVVEGSDRSLYKSKYNYIQAP